MIAASDAPATPEVAGLVLAGLLAAVAFGAILPVVPTGAAVSAALAYAWRHHPLDLALTVAAGAVGAYLGDLVVVALCRLGGRTLARRLRWLEDGCHDRSSRLRAVAPGTVRAAAGPPVMPGPASTGGSGGVASACGPAVATR